MHSVYVRAGAVPGGALGPLGPIGLCSLPLSLPRLAALLGVPLSGDHRGGGIEGGELRAHRGDVVLFPVIAPPARQAAHREGDVDTATLAGCHQRYQTPPPRPAVTGQNARYRRPCAAR